MNVLVFNEQDALPLSIESVYPLVASVLDLESWKSDEVNIHFVSSEAISKIHLDFFGDPTPTDCISFPIDSEKKSGVHHILGEVFVCPKTALDYVAKNGGNCYEETTLYLVHALLHLLGFDDMTDEEEEKMRAAEKKHMNTLLKKGLILRC